MGRNAYEIRLDTLSLAQKILRDEHDSQMEVWRHRKDIIAPGESGDTLPELPKSPSADDVLEEAEKLYAFISKGKDEGDFVSSRLDNS